jgi:hypothetical protein
MHPLFFIYYQLTYGKCFSFICNSRADFSYSTHCVFIENSKTNQDKNNSAKNLHFVAK